MDDNRLDEEKDTSGIEEPDHFTRMMLGPGRNQARREPLLPKRIAARSDESIDFALLMDVIEGIADTAEKLKPVVSSFYPEIKKIWKNK